MSGLDKESVRYVLIRDAARAAIAAMREPTDAMAEEGFQHTGDPCWPENVKQAWRAMIDTALADHYDRTDGR